MTIVHVTPYYAPAWAWGGVVEAVSGLARAQAAAGRRVHVVTTDTLGPFLRGPAGHAIVDGVEVTRVPTRVPALRARLNLSWTRGIAAAVGTSLAASDPAVLHCHEPRSIETVAAARAARRFGTPVVLSPHGTLPLGTGRGWAKRGWDALLARRLWRDVAHVTALTPAEAADVERFRQRWHLAHLAGACSVVPNGVDLSRYAALPARADARAALALPAHGPVVLFLGRLHERKGLDLLVDACALAIARGQPLHLLIAGPDAGMRAAIARQITTRGLASASLPGLLTGSAKLAALAAADVFVLPADGEGQPIAALEALASGVPIVVTRGVHLDDAVQAGAGILVERDPRSICQAIVDVLGRPGQGRAMGAAARSFAAARLGWEHAVAALDEVYRLAGGRQVRARPS